MKKFIITAAVAVVAAMVPASGNAQSLKDLISKGSSALGKSGSTISNVIDGVLSTSNLTVADLYGEYQGDGPAVSFKSENLLAKAGGVAASAAVESKLQPYFDKFGLNAMNMKVDKSGEFTIKIKAVTLTGTIEETSEKGKFNFKFKAFKKVSLGTVPAYISKSGRNLDLMFDATKFKTLLGSLSKVLNLKSLNMVNSLLDNYDGLCVGEKMKRTDNEESTGSGALDSLRGLLNKKSDK